MQPLLRWLSPVGNTRVSSDPLPPLLPSDSPSLCLVGDSVPAAKTEPGRPVRSEVAQAWGMTPGVRLDWTKCSVPSEATRWGLALG